MKIPQSTFGQVVAAPKQAVRVQADTAVADALQRAGGQVAGVAIDQLGLMRREAEERTELMNKARMAQVRMTTQNDLADLQDEFNRGIADGTIPKDQAAQQWEERTRTMLDGRTKDLPPEYSSLLSTEFSGYNRRGLNGVRDAVAKRDQQDTRGDLFTLVEQYERLAVREPVRARAELFAQVDALAPRARLTAEEIARTKQGYDERTIYTRAFTAVNAAKRSNGALDKVEASLNGEEYASMDPQRKAQLLTTLEGYRVSNIQRAEAEARRRDAEAERHLKQAEASFNAYNSLAITGKVPSPDFVQQVSAATAGTPYAAALRASMQSATQNTAFGPQSLAVQQRALIETRNALNAGGTNPEAERKVAEMQRIHDQAVKDYAEDPLLAAQERGVLQAVAPLDMRNLNTVVAGLGNRVNQASIVQQQVGQPVSPLLRSEAEQVAKLINILPVQERASAIAQVASTVGGPQAAALGLQMAPKDKALGIALGMAGSKTTQGRYTSELVLRGAQAMKDKSVKEDNAAVTGMRATIAAKIGDAYPNEEQRQTMIDAAIYAEYGSMADGQFKSDGVTLVTGGIVERGGAKVPLPYGWSADQFDQRLRHLSPVDIKTGTVVVDNVRMSAYDFLAKLPDAGLIYAGQGRYAVKSGSSVAKREDGRPLIIEVK